MVGNPKFLPSLGTTLLHPLWLLEVLLDPLILSTHTGQQFGEDRGPA